MESFRRLPDGTFWLGDEFGPFLVHTDAEGRVLQAPVAPPGVLSPDSPLLGAASPTLGRSKGFEGMVLSPNGRALHPLLEGAVARDDPQTLRLYSFNTRRGQFAPPVHLSPAGKPRQRHRRPRRAGLAPLPRPRAGQCRRPGRSPKAVYLLDTRDRDRDGYADKRLLVNLLAIPDPRGPAATRWACALRTVATLYEVSALTFAEDRPQRNVPASEAIRLITGGPRGRRGG